MSEIDGMTPEQIADWELLHLGPMMPCGHRLCERDRDEKGEFCGGCEPNRLPPVSEEAVEACLRRIRALREKKLSGITPLDPSPAPQSPSADPPSEQAIP